MAGAVRQGGQWYPVLAADQDSSLLPICDIFKGIDNIVDHRDTSVEAADIGGLGIFVKDVV